MLGFFGGGPQKILTSLSSDLPSAIYQAAKHDDAGAFWKQKNERYKQQQDLIKQAREMFTSEAGRTIVSQNLAVDAMMENRKDYADAINDSEFVRIAKRHFQGGTTHILEQQLKEVANNKEFRDANNYTQDDATKANEMIQQANNEVTTINNV